jgi:hypothetical protein
MTTSMREGQQYANLADLDVRLNTRRYRGFWKIDDCGDQLAAKIGEHAWGVTPYVLSLRSISTKLSSDPEEYSQSTAAHSSR